MKMRGLRGLPVLVAFAFAVGACSHSEVTGEFASSVSTTVAPATVAAGEAATVTCTVMGKSDDGRTWTVDTTTTFTIDPAESTSVEGVTVRATATGVYTLRCAAPDYQLVDEVGATLTVGPAAPVKVTTTIEQPTVKVFETTTVMCLVEDEYGNNVPVPTTVGADEQVIVNDHTVSSEQVGTYAVACALPDHPDVTVVPAELEVTAGDPAEVELLAVNAKPVYKIGMAVELYWIVRDAYGNEIPDLPGTLTAPQGVTTLSAEERRFRFTDEGEYTFSVTLHEPYELLTDDLTLIVDQSGPSIIIKFPERGATLVGDGDFVQVKGTVTDTFGDVAHFLINGETVDVRADGTFDYLQLPFWGLNVINCFAVDSYGNESKLSPTFLYSSEYLPYVETDAEGVRQSDGGVLLVGQKFLDDGDHDPTHPNDLATLLEIILGDLDLPTLLSDLLGTFETDIPLLDPIGVDLPGIFTAQVDAGLKFTVTATPQSDLGTTTATIDSRLGGIDFAIGMGDANTLALDIGLNIKAKLTGNILLSAFGNELCNTELVDVEADLFSALQTAEIAIGLKLDIHKPPDGELKLDIKDINIELVGLQVDPIDDFGLALNFDLCGLADFGFDFLLSDFFDPASLTDQILDPITEQILPLLFEVIEPLIETFADDLVAGLFDLLAFDLSFDLPPILNPAADPVALDIYADLSSIVFDEPGGTVGLGVGLYTDKGVERDPEGAIQRDGCLNDELDQFSYAWDKSLGLAAKTDMINSALFAIWWSGYLNGPIDLGGLLSGGGLPIPIDGLELELNWLLPPVLNDCGKGGLIEAEIGDLKAEVKGQLLALDIDATIFMDIRLSLAFTTTDEGLSVALQAIRFFDVEAVRVDNDPDGDVKVLLEDTLGGLLDSFLVGQEFGPIAIPEISLADLLPGLPPNAVLQLGNLGVSKDDGYIVIDGDLQ